ncbi:ABC transporter substrate binding protein [Candidatus Kuenenia sp.]|uniref:ABC transporter substrate-binding protein n=1 Tax=Candidatus Kuenenia sp. TaxID=2499824 RepID=UPI00321FBB76
MDKHTQAQELVRATPCFSIAFIGNISKQIAPVFVFLLALFAAVMLWAIPNATGSGYSAVIVKSLDITAYNDVAEGFKKQCRHYGISLRATYDLKGDIEEGKRDIQIIQELKPEPDIIITIGVLATTLARKHISNIPLLFCAVINHELLDLRGENIYGISSNVPFDEQFAVVNKMFQAQKKIGIIYDPAKTERIVSELTSLGSRHGYKFITRKVTARNAIKPALDDISKKIDVLWVVPDDTVISKESIGIFQDAVTKKSLPIFCTSSALVRTGALVSISPDYYSMGEQAAKMAQELLNGPLQNPPRCVKPEKLTITLNARTAEMLKVDISQFLSLPDVVIYK